MAFLSRSRLFGLLFLLTLPLDGAAALALAATAQQPQPEAAMHLSLEERLQRIGEAVRERDPLAAAEGLPDDALSFVFANAPAVGWVNGGFRNGGFYTGGFRNGGFHNGGFRNGGGWGNGGFRNGGFRNAW